MANNPPVIPSNDECDGAIELSLNMPIVGTTVDATRSSYLLFSNCSDDLNNADVWYYINFTNEYDGLNVSISNFSGDGLWGVQLFLASQDCNELVEYPDFLSTPYEKCGIQDKNFSLSTRCIANSFERIYIKVGTDMDDGNSSNGSETGDFTILATPVTKSCENADLCEDITPFQVIEPITNPQFILDYLCLESCLDFACPETNPIENACYTDILPTVWFQVNTDDIASQIFIIVETYGSWEAIWTLYGGADCSDLHQLSSMATPPCNNGDNTPDILQQAVEDSWSTYWVAVTVDPQSLPSNGMIDDPGFEICAATTINALVCLGDLESGDCAEPSLNFQITSVTNANGEAGEIDPNDDGLEGPFYPGSKVCLNMSFLYDASETGQEWLLGLVPTFGNGWDMEDFYYEANAPIGNGMTAQWYEEGGECNWVIQEPGPILCTFVNQKGDLELCNLLCESCPCAANTLKPGDQLPSGYAWVTNGGNEGCNNDCSPSEGWGIGSSTVQIEWNLCLKVKAEDDNQNCLNQNDLSIKFQTFSDGVAG
ncbi:MAG: hypothetical protein KDC16_12780, partial [Saprospiraceae bacterium]|nr:hypothetical protein [Saprospiraceae bacterium]